MINIYLHILQLDGLVSVLNQYERSMAHKKAQKHLINNENTKNMMVLIELVRQYRWCAPQVKYTDSRDLKYYDEDAEKWLNVEEYNHPIIDHAISIFKTQ